MTSIIPIIPALFLVPFSILLFPELCWHIGLTPNPDPPLSTPLSTSRLANYPWNMRLHACSHLITC